MKRLVKSLFQTEWAFLSCGHPQWYELIWRNIIADWQACQSQIFSPPNNNNEQLQTEEISVSIALFVLSRITYSNSGTSLIEKRVLLCLLCVWFRLYRQQLSAPFEEDARSGAAVWPPPSIPGKETSQRLRGFQYTRSPGGFTSLSQSAGQYMMWERYPAAEWCTYTSHRAMSMQGFSLTNSQWNDLL